MINTLGLKTPTTPGIKTPAAPHGNFNLGRKRRQSTSNICPSPSGQICKQGT